MKIIKSKTTKINDVNFSTIKFGEIFTDHMFDVIMIMINGKNQ